MPTPGNALQAARQKLGLSQSELAQAIGKSQARISNLETGKAVADESEGAALEVATSGIVKAASWLAERSKRREARLRRWADVARSMAKRGRDPEAA